MKIRVIDLLNMISKGEKVPKKIKYCGVDYYWTGFNYENSEADDVLFWVCIYSENHLNDDIEIIEDTPKEDKKIEKLEYWVEIPYTEKGEYLKQGLQEQAKFNENIYSKINEIIDKLNKEE